MSDSGDVQKINLLGEELPVRVSDTENAREAYTMVKDKLDSIRDRSNSPSNLQLALLCSLNIAGDLINSRENPGGRSLSDQLVDRIESLTTDIKQTLNDDN